MAAEHEGQVPPAGCLPVSEAASTAHPQSRATRNEVPQSPSSVALWSQTPAAVGGIPPSSIPTHMLRSTLTPWPNAWAAVPGALPTAAVPMSTAPRHSALAVPAGTGRLPQCRVQPSTSAECLATPPPLHHMTTRSPLRDVCTAPLCRWRTGLAAAPLPSPSHSGDRPHCHQHVRKHVAPHPTSVLAATAAQPSTRALVQPARLHACRGCRTWHTPCPAANNVPPAPSPAPHTAPVTTSPPIPSPTTCQSRHR